MTIGLQVSDDRFDGGAAAQLALDDTEGAALLGCDEDVLGFVPRGYDIIEIGPLARAP